MYVCVAQKPKRASDHLGLELGAGWERPVLLTTELFPTHQSPNSPLLEELSPVLNVIEVRQISPQNRDKGPWNSLDSKGQAWWPAFSPENPRGRREPAPQSSSELNTRTVAHALLSPTHSEFLSSDFKKR